MAAKSYVGCDYWPTVVPNLVKNLFDYAVVVSNVGTEDAHVVVTGPNGVNTTVAVAGGSLSKIFLPWVPALKGPALIPLSASVLAKGGAYHLVSDRPVVVYQFNPLEFRATGGEPGKDWSKCQKLDFTAPDCYSYSNDASLLLPSTAMTGNYRVFGAHVRDRDREVEDLRHEIARDGRPVVAAHVRLRGERLLAGGRVGDALAGAALPSFEGAAVVERAVHGLRGIIEAAALGAAARDDETGRDAQGRDGADDTIHDALPSDHAAIPLRRSREE
jgi:hypothetical protein